MNSIKTQLLERLDIVRNLGEDHGGENEKEPIQKTFDMAREVIESHYIAKPFLIGVTDEGNALFEFHENSRYNYADITFLDDGTVACYKKGLGEESEMFDTHYTSDKFVVFFEQLVE